MPNDSTRSLAALWFADIVGYSALAEQDEDAALRLVAQLQAAVEGEVPSRGGRIVKYVGDAALVAFESAGNAVEGALAVRDAFQGSEAARERGSLLRIGVHVGEIATAPDGDIYGDGVNIASRIQNAATPGGVYLSAMAAESIRHRSDLRTLAKGRTQVKGLSRPVDLFSVGWKDEAGDSTLQGSAGPPAEPATDFFFELKRRKVYRVGVAYLAVAFAFLEGADMVLPTLGLGPTVFNALVILSLVGFPLAVMLAWTFDVTGEGITRTPPSGSSDTAPQAPDRWVRLKAALVGAGFVLVAWAGIRAWQPLGGPTGPSVPEAMPSLAVLPPADFSPDGNLTYLTDGLHEEILHHLDQIPGLRLTSRTSSSFMRGVSPEEAAEALGVRYVLESSVRVASDSLLLTVQLIDVPLDDHIWSEALGCRWELDELLTLQRTLATRVAVALRGTLAPEVRVSQFDPPTNSLEAYNEFLRGLHQQSKFDVEEWWVAVDHYRRAVQLDPEFGRAHAKLAMILAMLNNYGDVTQGELFPRIREHSDAALRYAPDDPDTKLAQISVLWPMEWDWEASRQVYEELLAQNPDHVMTLWQLAEFYGVIVGDTERGLEFIQEATRVDPLSPALFIVRGWIFFNARRFEDCAKDYQVVVDADPGNLSSGLSLVSCLALAGRQAEARHVMDGILANTPPPRPPSLVAPLTYAGDTLTAREVLRASVARKESGGNVPASGIAAGYAVLGEVDAALDWLERSFEDEGGIYYLRNPDWDNVASEPRFQALWDRVGLYGEHSSLR